MTRLASRVGRAVATAACLAAVATVLALVAVSLSGQQVLTVMSGSMTPTFVAGDVVLVRGVTPDELEPGMVVTFHAPGQPEHLTTHRVLALHELPEGLFVQTKGDANEDPDPDFTNAAAVVGQVTTIAPTVGHWLVFYQSALGRFAILGTPLLLLGLGQLLQVRRDLVRLRARARAVAAEAPTRRRRRARTPAWTYAVVAGLSATAVFGGVAVGKATSSAYTSLAATPASFSTGSFCTATDYRTAVLASSPTLYYRLEETSGSSAADTSGNGRTATYAGSPSLGQTGGVCGGSRATRFTGSARLNPNTNLTGLLSALSTYSIEAWVRTPSAGTIASLTSWTSATRTLYVGTDGRVRFVSGNTNVLASTSSIAGTGWHHVVVTTNGSSSTLYVDGVAVDTGSGDSGILYATPGFGAQSTPPSGSASAPTSAGTDITLDELAVYTSVLPASSVTAHFTAAGGNG